MVAARTQPPPQAALGAHHSPGGLISHEPPLTTLPQCSKGSKYPDRIAVKSGRQLPGARIGVFYILCVDISASPGGPQLPMQGRLAFWPGDLARLRQRLMAPGVLVVLVATGGELGQPCASLPDGAVEAGRRPRPGPRYRRRRWLPSRVARRRRQISSGALGEPRSSACVAGSPRMPRMADRPPEQAYVAVASRRGQTAVCGPS